MDYAKESLKLHEQWKGKIEVVETVPVKSKEDLALAYTPGVAEPCLAIQKDVNKSYDLTRRHNMCLVVTDGSAVLGLGKSGYHIFPSDVFQSQNILEPKYLPNLLRRNFQTLGRWSQRSCPHPDS